MNADLLTAYEFARAQIRYGVFRQITRGGFHLNPVWLATGLGDRNWDKTIDSDLHEKVPPFTLFSEAFEKYIKPEIETHVTIYDEEEMGYPPHFEPPVGLATERIPGYYLLKSLPIALRFLERDPKLVKRFVDEVHKVTKKYLNLQSRRRKEN